MHISVLAKQVKQGGRSRRINDSPMQDNEVWRSCSSPNVYSSMKCALETRKLRSGCLRIDDADSKEMVIVPQLFSPASLHLPCNSFRSGRNREACISQTLMLFTHYLHFAAFLWKDTQRTETHHQDQRDAVDHVIPIPRSRQEYRVS